MGLDLLQFREHIVVPVLKQIDLHSTAAENLLIGTALTESLLKYVRQVRGPACGVFQMEPTTHDDIWANYLKYKVHLRDKVSMLMDETSPDWEQLVYNLRYGAAMCRVHYLRVPAALPAADDAEGLAKYWKDYYNTHLGAGTVEKALPYFEQAML
jgi:hypothetical protein